MIVHQKLFRIFVDWRHFSKQLHGGWYLFILRIVWKVYDMKNIKLRAKTKYNIVPKEKPNLNEYKLFTSFYSEKSHLVCKSINFWKKRTDNRIFFVTTLLLTDIFLIYRFLPIVLSIIPFKKIYTPNVNLFTIIQMILNVKKLKIKPIFTGKWI